MSVSEAVDRIIDELEFIEAERRQLKAKGPHFMIVQRDGEQCNACASHRDFAAVYLLHQGRFFQVSLGTVLMRLFDYLARHNRVAQTAKQIENGTRIDLSLRVPRDAVSTSVIPRRYVRVYVRRIRQALGVALRQAGLEIESDAVLASDGTALNEVGYRFHGTFEWLNTAEVQQATKDWAEVPNRVTASTSTHFRGRRSHLGG